MANGTNGLHMTQHIINDTKNETKYVLLILNMTTIR